MSNLAFQVDKKTFVKDFLSVIAKMGDGIITIQQNDNDLYAIAMHTNQTMVMYTRYTPIKLGPWKTMALRNVGKIIKSFQFVSDDNPSWTIEGERQLSFKNDNATIEIPLVPKSIADQQKCAFTPQRIDEMEYDVELVIKKEVISNILQAQGATDGTTVELIAEATGIFAKVTNRDVRGGDVISTRIATYDEVVVGQLKDSWLLPTDLFAIILAHGCDITMFIDQTKGKFIFVATTANSTTKYAQVAITKK